MLTKTTIALSLALVMGAASAAMADYHYDASGAPTGPYIVDAPNDAYASTRAPREFQTQHAAPFTTQEQMLFDRETYPVQ
jgi:hypothetical protein